MSATNHSPLLSLSLNHDTFPLITSLPSPFSDYVTSYPPNSYPVSISPHPSDPSSLSVSPCVSSGGRLVRCAQESLCSVGEVLQGEARGVLRTVVALLMLAPPRLASPPAQLAGFALFYLSIMSLLCVFYCHLLPRL